MVELKKCYMRGAKDHRAHSSCIIGIRENWKTLNLIRHEKDRGQQVGTYLGGRQREWPRVFKGNATWEEAIQAEMQCVLRLGNELWSDHGRS